MLDPSQGCAQLLDHVLELVVTRLEDGGGGMVDHGWRTMDHGRIDS